MALLVLGLGNDLLRDDAVGLLAARALRGTVPPEVRVEESQEVGFALLDLLSGYDAAILLDAIQTGRVPPGTIHRFALEALGAPAGPSPHYAGLPEVLALGRTLGLSLPSEGIILAVEVEDPFTVAEGLTGPVAASLPFLVEEARKAIDTLPGARGSACTSSGSSKSS